MRALASLESRLLTWFSFQNSYGNNEGEDCRLWDSYKTTLLFGCLISFYYMFGKVGSLGRQRAEPSRAEPFVHVDDDDDDDDDDYVRTYVCICMYVCI